MVVNPASLGGIVFLALAPALLAYFLYSKAMPITSPAQAGPFLHLSPVFAIVLPGGTLRGYHLFGVAMIALSLYLKTGRKAPSR